MSEIRNTLEKAILSDCVRELSHEMVELAGVVQALADKIERIEQRESQEPAGAAG